LANNNIIYIITQKIKYGSFKITKKVKLSRHRRRHRRNLTRSGGSPARRSRHTPHGAAQNCLERLRKSELTKYSLKSVADLALRTYTYSNIPENISNIVKDSSCDKARTISALISLASVSGQTSGNKQINQSGIDKIFDECGLNKLTEPEILKLLNLCIKDFFGPCQSGGKYKGNNSQRLSNPGHGRWTAAQIAQGSSSNGTSDDGGDCCTGILVLAGAIFVMMFLSGAGRFVGAP